MFRELSNAEFWRSKKAFGFFILRHTLYVLGDAGKANVMRGMALETAYGCMRGEKL